MLLCKIEKVELIESTCLGCSLRITACNGETDVVEVTIMCGDCNAILEDDKLSSYTMTGERLSNKITKVSGALAGARFALHSNRAIVLNISNFEDDVFGLLSGVSKAGSVRYCLQFGKFSVIINGNAYGKFKTHVKIINNEEEV